MSIKTLTYVIMGKDELTPTFKKAGKEAEASSSGIAGSMSKAGFAGVALAGIIGGALIKSIKDARGEGWGPLKVAAKDAGVAFDAFKPKVEDAGKSMANLGFTQADTNKSLKYLLTSTQSAPQSLNALATAADFARFKGIGLSDASQALAKAATGSTRALKDVGISTADLPKHFASTGTAASRMQIIMDLLQKRTGGAAKAFSEGFGGKLAVVRAQLENVSAKVGSALLPILSALLTMVSKNILPAIQKFGDWFGKVGAPAVKAFADRLTPIVSGVIRNFFTGVSAIVKVALALPGPLKIAALAVAALGVAMKLAAAGNPWIILGVVIITLVGLIINNWTKIANFTKQVWGAIRNFVVGVWHAIYDTTMSIINRVVSIVKTGFNAITGAVALALTWIKTHWPLLLAILTGPIGAAALIIIRHWSNIKNAAANAFNTVVGFFRALPGRILSAIGNVGHLLTSVGQNIISGMYNGIIGALGNAANWVKVHIFDKIVGAIKGLFGIHSPSTVMAGLGGNMMQGVFSGMLKTNPTEFIKKVFGSLPNALGGLIGKGLVNIAKLPAKALSALGSVAGKVGGFFGKLFGGGGSGVQRWAGLVAQVLAMFGQPLSLVPTVLRRMNQESGGNPNAINLWDSNAKAGDPSRGLMQTIMGTFMRFAGPFVGRGIYDPLANIYASMAYAISTYGSLSAAYNRAGGYAGGTKSAKRGWAWVGERGRELMFFNGGEGVMPNRSIGAGGSTIIWTGDVVVRGHALATKQEIGALVSDALTEFERKGGRTR